MNAIYCAVDLHSNNGYYGIVEKSGKRVFGKRLPNKLETVLDALEPFKERLERVAVESTYNWYWLVDGLMENGYDVRLANPAAMDQYSGMKNTDDKTDAFFIADLMRLGILPEGHVYPKDERGLRDMLRRRTLFVRQRTAQTLSLQNMLSRQSGKSFSMRNVQKMKPEEFLEILGGEDNMFTARQNIDTIRVLSEKIRNLEDYILSKTKLKPEFEKLTTIPGIGKILGLTIMYETGDIGRFKDAGNYTSYCRCVKAEAKSNNKKKGHNNRKNGNKHLSWAFVEAAQKMRQFCPEAQAFYDKKKRRKCAALATKALASKISKAVYHILRDKEEFEVKKMFG